MPNSSEEGWGSWNDAERWREATFLERSPLARLAWLEDIWRLKSVSVETARLDSTIPGSRSTFRPLLSSKRLR